MVCRALLGQAVAVSLFLPNQRQSVAQGEYDFFHTLVVRHPVVEPLDAERCREMEASHQLEKVGEELRELYSWNEE